MRKTTTLFNADCVGEVAVVTPTTDLGEFTYEHLAREASKLLESFEDRSKEPKP